MPRIRKRQNFHSNFDRGRIVSYRNIGLSYREIGCCVNCTVMTIMRVCCVWTEETTGIRRRSISQSRRTTQYQDRRKTVIASGYYSNATEYVCVLTSVFLLQKFEAMYIYSHLSYREHSC